MPVDTDFWDGPKSATSADSVRWLEIHFDDEILCRDGSHWPHARKLAETVANIAESKGARFCFRFRSLFAQHARGTGLLPNLVQRGHQVGVHAHGRGLGRAVAALGDAGVMPEVGVPGLVQGGPRRRNRILAESADLGLRLVCDHGEELAWAYDGVWPRFESGVWVLAPLVRPFDWGLMTRDGTRHGITKKSLAELRRLEGLASGMGARSFGAAFHEHDLCPPHSLHPNDAALEAMADFLDERIQPVPLPPVGLVAGGGERERDPEPSGLGRRGARRGFTALRAGLRARKLSGLEKQGDLFRLSVGEGTSRKRLICVERLGAENPEKVCVLWHAGAEGGRRLRMRPFGLSAHQLTETGWAVWMADRTGTGDSDRVGGVDLSPGNSMHDEDWRAVLQRVRSTSPSGVPVVALTWSAGLIPVLRGMACGVGPDALVDGEGPVDRWSLRWPAQARAQGLDRWDLWDGSTWDGLEAVDLVAKATTPLPYVRLQGTRDHAHGWMTDHAVRLDRACRQSGWKMMGPTLGTLPGSLAAHGAAVVRSINWAAEQVVCGAKSEFADDKSGTGSTEP